MKRLLIGVVAALVASLAPQTGAGADGTWQSARSASPYRQFLRSSDATPAKTWSGERSFSAACFESPRTDPRDSARLDVVEYGAFYGCVEPGAWLFPVETFDSWTSSALDSYLVQIDTDGTSTNGCGGYEFAVAAVYDNGLVGGIIRTPSCTSSTWTSVGAISVQRPTTKDIGMLFPTQMIGSPTKIIWSAGLLAANATTWDDLPNSGVHTDQLAAPSSGSPTTTTPPPGGTTQNPCPPVTHSDGQRRRYASSSSPSLPSVLTAAGMRAVRSLGGGVTVFSGDLRIAAAALQAAGIAADLGDDYRIPFTAVPDDPGYVDQWYLPAVGADRAWEVTRGSESVVVAVLDTGVDGTHSELAGRLTAGWDTISGSPLAAGNTDPVGHGTATAGLVAASTSNARGIASLGWHTRVMPVRIGNAEGATAADLMAGLRYAADNGARIINVSLGSECTSGGEANAVSYAQGKGALIVAAAGNERQEGNPVEYPAAHPGVLAVGATTRTGTVASYSNSGSYIDLVAPGGAAGSSVADSVIVLAPMPAAFDAGSGTSFSSPIAAAAAALVLAANPGMSAAAAGERLVATARDAGPAGRDNEFGAGILDAAAAVGPVSSTTTTTTAPATTTTTAPGPGAQVVRLSGGDRMATAVAISQSGFPSGGVEAVVLARADDFPDALAGAPFAAGLNAPLLLTGSQSLDGRVHDEIRRVLPAGGSVYVLGGESAIGRGVEDALRAGGHNVVRVSGRNRYETATLISERVADPSAAFLVTGTSFPDALAAGAAASSTRGVVLLTAGAAMPAETAAYLQARPALKRYAIGGPAAAAAPGSTVVTGANRYETSANVARTFFPGAAAAGVASGLGFADALPGGAHVGRRGGPLLLVPFESAPQSVRDWLGQHRPSLREVFIYGGTSTVSQQVESEVRQLTQ